jgi:hypothetical protein
VYIGVPDILFRLVYFYAAIKVRFSTHAFFVNLADPEMPYLVEIGGA